MRTPWRVTTLYITVTDRVTAKRVAGLLGGFWKGRTAIHSNLGGEVSLTFRFHFPQKFKHTGLGDGVSIGCDPSMASGSNAPRHCAFLLLHNSGKPQLQELKDKAKADVLDTSRQMFVYGKQYGRRGGARVTHAEYATQR